MPYSTVIIIALAFILACYISFRAGFKAGQRHAARAFQVMLDTVQKSIIKPVAEELEKAKNDRENKTQNS